MMQQSSSWRSLAVTEPTLPNPWTAIFAPLNDTRRGHPLLHAVGVHHPGHHLLVRVQVRGRDITIGSNDTNDLGSVPARHPFQLSTRHPSGIAADPALGTAIWEADQCALPGLQPPQRPPFF